MKQYHVDFVLSAAGIALFIIVVILSLTYVLEKK
jgi:hypothetical protein